MYRDSLFSDYVKIISPDPSLEKRGTYGSWQSPPFLKEG
jgi:hypothetical protein